MSRDEPPLWRIHLVLLWLRLSAWWSALPYWWRHHVALPMLWRMRGRRCLDCGRRTAMYWCLSCAMRRAGHGG